MVGKLEKLLRRELFLFEARERQVLPVPEINGEVFVLVEAKAHAWQGPSSGKNGL